MKIIDIVGRTVIKTTSLENHKIISLEDLNAGVFHVINSSDTE